MRDLYRYLGIGLLAVALAGCAGESAQNAEVADSALDSSDLGGEAAAPEASGGSAAPDAAAPYSPPSPESRAAAEPARPAPAPRTAVIPAGTALPVILIDSISTDENQAGDVFLASLAEAVSVNGTVVLDKGTTVQGRVLAAEDSGRVRGRASIQLALTEILAGSRNVAISTETFSQTAEASTGRDAAIGAAGGAVGAIIGGLTGGTKGAVIGGGAGAAGSVMATKGEELSYPSESRLTFTLDESVEVALDRPIS